MRCPQCSLENPEAAIRCDCGYNFSQGAAAPIFKTPTGGLRPWLAAITFLLVLNLLQALAGDSWAYSVIAPKDDDLLLELNRVGAQGYEVVSARRAGGGDEKKAAYELILKRRSRF